MINKKLIVLLLLPFVGWTQSLHPTVDKKEIHNSLVLAMDIQKAFPKDSLLKHSDYINIYRSKEIGLTNQWGLYKNEKTNVHEIVVRGTVNKGSSWLANYYAAMIPANGEIQLSNTQKVQYHLADDNRATVHAGWTIASLYLMEEIKPKIDSLYKHNNKEFIISGHSQGGVITYLLTANLRQMQEKGKLPKDIVFKTYALAPPKPGNLYFTYQYEKMTQAWSYSVSNTQDWVPEVPPTTQTLNDFNPISPFNEVEVNKAMKKISWPKRMFAKGIFNKINNPTEKSSERYQKYLGSFIFKMIHKQLPELIEPAYSDNSDYNRCSNPVILDGLQDKAYQEKFDKPENIMSHHLPPAYLYLLKKQL
ncbi:MAG: lipase family protein [Flavobacteriaceae bacterium]|jgi:hypothetical protein|nr:lipase family protein [Flavobacteriaceae bacterium]